MIIVADYNLKKHILFYLIALSVVSFVEQSFAQSRYFTTSNRGGAAGAKQNAQITKLTIENQDRKAENNAQDVSITQNVSDIDALEAEVSTFKPHAKQAQLTCSAGELIRWDGSAYTCVSENDPSAGEHALTTTVPPDCHDVNAKLLWNASTKQWHCEADMNDGSGGGWSGAETDPTVQSTSSGRMCYGTGSKVACDSVAPSLSGGSLVVSGNLEVGGDLTGGSADFTGAVSAVAPTATNHLTTKAYVDATVAAAAGGGGGGGYACGMTRQEYQNSANVSTMDAHCAAEYGSGWRMATLGNLTSQFRSYTYNQIYSWIIPNGSMSSGGSIPCMEVRMQDYYNEGYAFGVHAETCSKQNSIACCNF